MWAWWAGLGGDGSPVDRAWLWGLCCGSSSRRVCERPGEDGFVLRLEGLTDGL